MQRRNSQSDYLSFRNLDLVFENSTTFQGLIGNRFVSDKKMFDNGTEVPSRQCYCHDKECQPSGALNISTCKFGAPAFVSLPHFYLADPVYRSQITGMNPKKEHETSIVVEPVRLSLFLKFILNTSDSLCFLLFFFPRIQVFLCKLRLNYKSIC